VVNNPSFFEFTLPDRRRSKSSSYILFQEQGI